MQSASLVKLQERGKRSWSIHRLIGLLKMHLFAQFRRTLPKGFMGFSAAAAAAASIPTVSERGERQTDRVRKPSSCVTLIRNSLNKMSNHLYKTSKLFPIMKVPRKNTKD